MEQALGQRSLIIEQFRCCYLPATILIKVWLTEPTQWENLAFTLRPSDVEGLTNSSGPKQESTSPTHFILSHGLIFKQWIIKGGYFGVNPVSLFFERNRQYYSHLLLGEFTVLIRLFLWEGHSEERKEDGSSGLYSRVGDCHHVLLSQPHSPSFLWAFSTVHLRGSHLTRRPPVADPQFIGNSDSIWQDGTYWFVILTFLFQLFSKVLIAVSTGI